MLRFAAGSAERVPPRTLWLRSAHTCRTVRTDRGHSACRAAVLSDDGQILVGRRTRRMGNTSGARLRQREPSPVDARAHPARIPGVTADPTVVELPIAARPIDICVVGRDGNLKVVERKLDESPKQRQAEERWTCDRYIDALADSATNIQHPAGSTSLQPRSNGTAATTRRGSAFAAVVECSSTRAGWNGRRSCCE